MKNKQDIITLYRQGKSCRKIAETVEADKDTVYRYIAEYNKMHENYLVGHSDNRR
ncbi:MAG: helix-turn-helix domain-containing protein [Clostridia bacterium]|nr:helix-turn-helix domain-containing protein [Clostridia bacterium]